MISLFDFYKIKKGQKDIDFVVPFLDTDRKFFIDPALIRHGHAKLDEKINKYLEIVNKYIKLNDPEKIMELLNIGESRDIGFGYCKIGTRGSGIGKEVSRRTISLIISNKKFREQGLTRLEELQWLDENIGPDRISDLVGNIIKSELIKYTKEKAKKNDVPTQLVRVNKIFDWEKEEWVSQEHVLPVNEMAHVRDILNPHPPILLIPTSIAKMLPLFLDYDGYYGFIDPKSKSTGKRKFIKSIIRDKTIQDPSLSLGFINQREKDEDRLYKQDFTGPGPDLYERIDATPTGRQHANEYRKLVAEILSYLFEKDLSLIGEEAPTALRENRRDIIFSNDSSHPTFLNFKSKYDATNITVDAKNTNDVTSKDVAQVSNYLNSRRGRVGFIVSRKSQKNIRSHQISQLKDHEKLLIHISDEDLKLWIRDKMRLNADGDKKETSLAVKSLGSKYKDIELS